MAKLGDAALEPLHGALKDQDYFVRKEAVAALGLIGNPNSIDHCIAALTDDDARVREAVVRALGEFKSERTLPALIGALKDKAVSVQKAAVRVLGYLGGAEAMLALNEALPNVTNENVIWEINNICNPSELYRKKNLWSEKD